MATFAILCALAGGCGSITSSTPEGGAGGSGGGDASSEGKGDADTDARSRGFCNTAADCVFQPTDGCCGSCLAIGDQPSPPQPICGAVDCAAPPGGCSCMNHLCTRGILTAGSTCNPQHDECGSGDKCCQACGVAPLDGGGTCPATCVTAMFSTGQLLCPLVP